MSLNSKYFPLQNIQESISFNLYILENMHRKLLHFPFQIKINQILLNMIYRKVKKKKQIKIINIYVT